MSRLTRSSRPAKSMRTTSALERFHGTTSLAFPHGLTEPSALGYIGDHEGERGGARETRTADRGAPRRAVPAGGNPAAPPQPARAADRDDPLRAVHRRD